MWCLEVLLNLGQVLLYTYLITYLFGGLICCSWKVLIA